jgi:polyhydroxybutyrate depolymerase
LFISWSRADAAADDLLRKEWKVNGITREALIFVPATAKTTPTPVVFAFHGHGGSMNYAVIKFRIHKLWPAAIAVYMQGLPTPVALTDPQGKRPGWQETFGDQGDRDLQFFDAVLATLKHDDKIDEKRIYVTGHSNGGAFTYLLWAARGDLFAAIAPCAAAARPEFKPKLKPMPVLHIAGENDPLVRFAWQKRTIDEVRKVDHCEKGGPWGGHCTMYPSKTGTPVVTYIHSDGHQLPDDALPVIVKFFKLQVKR